MYRIWAATVSLIFVFSVSLADVKMRWCYIPEEEAKCKAFTTALADYARNNLSLSVSASCVGAKDRAECVDKITKKEVDLVTLGRKEIVSARKSPKLVLVAAEDYGQGKGVKYYGVAVVKQGTKFDINDLKGKTSCHTGAARTAGWDIPIGFLLSKGIMERPASSRCSPYVAVANFFNESCVPGALSPKFDPEKQNPDNLCAICGGSGVDKCDYSSKEPYFGHGGSLRCLVDGKGDVAFFKSGTVMDMIKKEPAKFGNASDYKYLCPDGTKKDIGQQSSCSLGTSPSQPIITWSGNENRENYKNILIGASKEFGPSSAKFQMFNSTTYGGEDLLFKDSTLELIDVGDKSPIETWLEQQYRKDMEAINDCVETPTATTSSASKAVPFISLLFILILTTIHSSI